MEESLPWLDVTLFTLTFVACVGHIVASTLRPEDRPEPLPYRRFLPLGAVLASSFTGVLAGLPLRVGLAVALAILMPGLLLRWLLIPLGSVRVSYWLASLSGPLNGRDVTLRPLVVAARALRRRPSPSAVAFVERRLAVEAELGPLGACVAAALAEAAGDVPRALGILRGADCVSDPAQRREFCPLLREIVLAHASAHGGRAEIARFTDAELTRDFERAEPDASTAEVSATNGPSVVAPSLAAFAALARRLPERVRAEDTARACASLDALRGSDVFAAAFRERALVLGVTAPDSAFQTLLREAEGELAAACVERRWPLTWLGTGPTAETVRALVREQRLATLERLARELLQRSRDERDLPEVEEWQAWGELALHSREFESDAAEAHDRELHFRALHRPLWSYGYRQGFVLGRRHLARSVFLRQRRLAYAARAAETYDVIEGNLRAAGFPAGPPLSEPQGEWLCDRPRTQRLRQKNATLRQFAILLLAIGSVAAFGAWGPRLGSLLLVCAALGVEQLLLREPAVVELASHEGRLVVQTAEQRVSLVPSELRLVAGFGRISRVVLARPPFWLPGSVWTVHASVADALRVRRDLAARAARTG